MTLPYHVVPAADRDVDEWADSPVTAGGLNVALQPTPDCRTYAFGRTSKEGVAVVRVLHGTRDFDRIFATLGDDLEGRA